MFIKGVDILVVRSAAGAKKLTKKNASAFIAALNTSCGEETIRSMMRKNFNLARNKKTDEIVFSVDPAAVAVLSCDACARIMSQEAWRYLRNFRKPPVKKIFFAIPSQKNYGIFNKTLNGYLEHLINDLCQGPFVTADGIINYRGGVVLIERSNPPFGWALPGGFLDYGETVEETAVREVKEETGLDFYDFKLFKVCSSPKRDPRFQTVTVVFSGKGKGILKAASDAKNIGIFRPGSLPDKMAFDHRQILQEYFKKIKVNS